MKKSLVIIFLVIGSIIVGICFYSRMAYRDDYEFIVSVPVKDVVEKKESDGFYLTVIFDNSIVDMYDLSYNKASIRVNESIYDKVAVNSGIISVSLKVVVPYNQGKQDLGLILKEQNMNLCRIISVTTQNNNIIE